MLRRLAGAAAVFGLLAGMLACSPALDWRQVRPDGWNALLSMPCRPARQSRTVPLAGQPVEMTLLACSAEEHSYAVVSADVGDPARVGPALLALAESARDNLRGVVQSDQDASVPGMTPQQAARRWQLRGQLPGGQAVMEQGLVFAHGLRVYQATVVGPSASVERGKAFFETFEVSR